MRTVNDGRGEEPWEEPITSPSSDDEATQVFSREDLTSVPTPSGSDGVETTREFFQETGNDTTREFRRDDDSPVPTASGIRDSTRLASDFDAPYGAQADESGGTAFTRRFVRERPGPRGHGQPPWDPGPSGEDVRWPSAGERGHLRGRRDEPSQPPRPRRRERRRFRLRWLVTLLLLTALAVPPATWGWVWYTARQDDRVTSDAIVVLGASQYNGVPSPVFEARLRHAQVLYLEGVAPVIVTVGGKQPGDNFTEAESGRDWLIEVGIPSDQIIAVEEGRDTLQSISAVSLVFEERSWDTAVLVSDPWHSLRSQRMAAAHGIEAGTSPARSGPAVIERQTQLWYITRETASLWYYWIFNDSSDIRVNAA